MENVIKDYVFGVDVGGTTVKIGIFKIDGTLIEKWEIPTNIESNGENILPDISKSINWKLDELKINKSEVIGVGIGVPGPVDSKGVVHKAVNLGWGFFNIKEEGEKLFDLPVVAGNDASVATLGEMWQGAGKGHSNVVMITIGTGVGGGVVVDEKIVSGAVGGSGEIGHITVDFHEIESCGCGKKGCLEQYASATGIVTNFKRFISDGKYKTTLETENITAKDIVDGAKAGDDLCQHVVKETGRLLGIGLSYAGCICDPEIYLVGGGVSKAGDILLKPIENSYKKYVFHSATNTPIKLATLGNDAGIYGSARQLL